MSSFMTAGNWIMSVVVVGVLIHVIGSFVFRKEEDWLASTSKTRAKKQVQRLEEKFAYIEILATSQTVLMRVLFKAVLLALNRIAIGLVFIFYPLPLHGQTGEIILQFKTAVGVGSILSAWTYIAFLTLPDIDKVRDFMSYKTKIDERIKHLKELLQKDLKLPVDPPAAL